MIRHWKVTEAENGEFYAFFDAGNSEELVRTSETYVDKRDAVDAIGILYGNPDVRHTKANGSWWIDCSVDETGLLEVRDCSESAVTP